jgi:2-polyprenyl-6-methoxyphenol hydroxylase-like FAD-dependent oxidoreductase
MDRLADLDPRVAAGGGGAAKEDHALVFLRWRTLGSGTLWMGPHLDQGAFFNGKSAVPKPRLAFVNRSPRILIVGGGMAGWTLAGLLERQGITPTLIEKTSAYGRVGFWIGLYPFSAAILRQIGGHEKYDAASLRMENYCMHDAHGARLQEMSFAQVFASIHGFMGALHRADLLEILRATAPATRLFMGTTLQALEQKGDAVQVEFSDGRHEEFDLVIGADGIHSSTRRLLLGETPLKDWGYTAFTWWTPPYDAVGSSVHEFWGTGSLFGLYPLKDRINAIGGLPTPPDLASMEQTEIKALLRSRLADHPAPVQAALEHLEEEKVFAWPMIDQRAPEWIVGRVALLGDAATGFLPTAGVGASNAIKSAGVLGDELSRCDAATIPLALSLWEKRVRHKVEANQSASRTLAKMMFVNQHPLAILRDALLKHYPVEKIAEDILKSHTEPW